MVNDIHENDLDDVNPYEQYTDDDWAALETEQYEALDFYYKQMARREDVFSKRLTAGQVNTSFLDENNVWSLEDLPEVAIAFAEESAKNSTDGQGFSAFVEAEADALIDFYSHVFPELESFLQNKLAEKPNADSFDKKRVLEAFFDGADLPDYEPL